MNRLPLTTFMTKGIWIGALFGFVLAFMWKSADKTRAIPEQNPQAPAVAEEESTQILPAAQPDAKQSEVVQGAVAGALFVAEYSVSELPPPLPAPPRSNIDLLHVADARAALELLLPEILKSKGEERQNLVAIMAQPHAKGKTCMAVALAHLAAQSGLNVLILSDHGQKRENEPGLLDVVSRKINPRDLVLQDPMSDFALMRSGCVVPTDLWELARHRNFSLMMQRIKSIWDLVIIELPERPEGETPYMPPSLVDALVLISHPLKHKPQDVQAALDECSSWLKVPVVTVVNKAPA